MLAISTISIVLLAIAYLASRHFENQSPSVPHTEMLRLGVQIICGDCCGDAHRPVKTYLDQFGRCVQCGGRSYVLASMCVPYRITALPFEATNSLRRPSFESEVSLRAVRIHKIGA